MKIALDAMGGDFSLFYSVKGEKHTDVFPDGVAGSVDPMAVLTEFLHKSIPVRQTRLSDNEYVRTLSSNSPAPLHSKLIEPITIGRESKNNFILSLKMGESNLHLRLENETHNNNHK